MGGGPRVTINVTPRLAIDGLEYCYLNSYAANRGVLEIDRIELVR